ncbi:MAG: zinc transporter ZupT [Campylobacteraceae bacterium]|nr:zinc transporter ZupT [Campylobacteraceae bacterium]
MDITLQQFMPAFLLTLLAGLSTGIGALLAFFSKSKSHTFLSIGLGFSAGVMIYVSFVEILPKSNKAFTAIFQDAIIGELLGLLCFFGGIGLSAFIDKLIPEDINPHELKSDNALSVLKDDNHHTLLENSALKRTGIFTALAIGIHNFPEGFATFIAAIDNINIGITIALAIAIHNIPEGMAVSLPIYHATGNRKTAFWYAFISGLAEPIGAIIGFFLLLPLMGESTFGITFGFVAGIMVYISFDELLPSARLYGNAHTTILGIVLGMMVMSVSLVAFKLI